MKTVHHPTLPTSMDVDDEAVGDWLEQGWLEDVPLAADPDYDQVTATVPGVLAYVGSNPARVSEALEVEKSRGEAARSSLVSQLEKLQEGSNR